jgi:hypothetical protein
MTISTTAYDEHGREIAMWTSADRLYWTAEGKLTTDRYKDGLPLVLACIAGGQVPLEAARASGLIKGGTKR